MAGISMGLGRLGQPDVILKRKFRFKLWVYIPALGAVHSDFVKVAARPQLDVDEMELNFLNGVTWIPGKGRWQPLNVTYLDVTDTALRTLHDWISTIYELVDPDKLHQSEKSGWIGTGYVEMYDGCGTLLEQWTLNNMWPQSVNWGDLDYANSEEATIDVVYRYSDVKCVLVCPGGGIASLPCKGC